MAGCFEEPRDPPADGARAILSDKVLHHALNPRNMGEMPRPDGYARVAGPCGDIIQFCLRVTRNRITDVRFMTTGCAPSVACGSMTSELVIGKTVSQALEVTQDDILENLGGLPESEVHCARLAAMTLAQALRDHLSIRREPWKKAYRTVEPFWAK